MYKKKVYCILFFLEISPILFVFKFLFTYCFFKTLFFCTKLLIIEFSFFFFCFILPILVCFFPLIAFCFFFIKFIGIENVLFVFQTCSFRFNLAISIRLTFNIRSIIDDKYYSGFEYETAKKANVSYQFGSMIT